ncbi:MAG: 16S rRNA (guanine(527)-N(7))-methyltransferase RsmG [Oscillospiraceae bacterium]|jgi:16S rRNA (guanine527-N7)-methyltransferase|nr:16S rRNA (guanine(527)-N(7))-methyltransferase RsmG [Oscillospiraceae bacterium]
MEEQVWVRLAAGCAALGIPLDAAQDRPKWSAYHTLLTEANARMDLTAVQDPLETVDRHYLDCLAPLAKPGLLPQGALCVDVGTGAGFPGVPLALVRPDLRWVLLDAQAKRVAFLRQVIAALGLNAQALHARAEDAARLAAHRERYDLATSRAVAALPALLELTLPFVRPGGWALAWKGPATAAEWPAAQAAAGLLGGALRPPLSAPVPGRDWHHLLIIADKRQKTVSQYPRKAGEPGRKPLGITP